MRNVLIIAGEKDLVQTTALTLEKEGYRTATAQNGRAGVESALNNSPHLILLDFMLPDLPGKELCQILTENEKTASIPIILLIAGEEEIESVDGFELRAYDYMMKPLCTGELLLRVKVMLRRAGRAETARDAIRVGVVTIDADRHFVSVAGAEITLTTTEFKLLSRLAEGVGRMQSRERLLKDIWGISPIADTRTLDTHLTRLRAKLGEAGGMIKTVRGVGYRMEAP